MNDLQDRVAIVTGGGSGIGLAIARAFAAEGASVILAGRREDRLHEAASAIIEEGGAALGVACDVTSETEVDQLFAKVADRFGRLDVLVNNAGIVALAPLDELDVAAWDRVIATNLRGAFLCSRAAVRMMKPRKSGRIINIGSLSAQRVRAGNGAYNASKFGLEGLTHSLALEGRPHGISCGSLHPGNTASEITDRPGFSEPIIRAEDIARTAALMAAMPANASVFQAIVMPIEQLYVGRG